ncbi:hypothetical protein NXY55_21775, partial [Aeromonas veronii]|nr:hypothetical protein [Aeromonas veronii]
SRTVPQGMSALLAFNPSGELEANQSSMTDALSNVKTGQITYAVRDTNIDGIDISKDDYMGIAEGKIVVTDKDKLKAAKDLLAKIISVEEDEIVTIIYGQDASEDDVNAIVVYLEDEYEDIEVEVHNGDQPLYAFIFSVE